MDGRVCIRCNAGIAQTRKRPYCKDCRNAYERAHYNHESDRNRHLRYWYGVENGWYEKTYAEQGGKCAICGEFRPVLCVDHNHEDGTVRQLLCQHCNTIVGKIEHPLFSKALQYINYHGKRR